MATRLILWKLGPRTITRRGLWTRERSIYDVMEPKPEYLDEMREHMRREAAYLNEFPGLMSISRPQDVSAEVTEEQVNWEVP